MGILPKDSDAVYVGNGVEESFLFTHLFLAGLFLSVIIFLILSFRAVYNAVADCRSSESSASHQLMAVSDMSNAYAKARTRRSAMRSKRGTVAVLKADEHVDSNAAVLGLTLVPHCAFPARTGASMAICEETGNTFIFGGEGARGLEDDLLIYSQQREDWTWLSGRGPQPPGPVAYASMVSTPNHLLLYGGMGPDQKLSNKLHLFDLPLGEWRLANMQEGGEEPEARFGASLEPWRPGVWVLFGGCGAGNRLLTDVWALEEVPRKAGDHSPWSFRWRWLSGGKQAQDVSAPLARRCHSACVVNGEDMVVLGGYTDGQGRPEGAAVGVFSLKTLSWRREQVAGMAPSGVEGGRAFTGGKCVVYIGAVTAGIFNETFVLDVAARPFKWAQVEVEWQSDWTLIPGLRTNFAAARDPSTGDVIIFGGEGSGVGAQNQMLMLRAGQGFECGR